MLSRVSRGGGPILGWDISSLTTGRAGVQTGAVDVAGAPWRYRSSIRGVPVRWAALCSGAAVVALAAAGAALEVHNNAGDMFASAVWVQGLAAALAYGAPGAHLAARYPRNAVGWLCLVIGGAYAASMFGVAYGTYGLETSPGSLPHANFLLWIGLWVWAPAYGAIPSLLLLIVPSGTLLSRRWRPVAWLGGVGIVGMSLAWALTPYGDRDVPVEVPGAFNPVGAVWAGWLYLAGVPLLGAAAAGVASLVVRMRRAHGAERDQAAWILLGATATIALLLTALVLPYDAAGQYLVALALVPLPLSVAVAVFRHGLWDVRLVVNRSLVYGTLALLVLIAYGAAVWVLGGLLGRTTGAPILAVVVVAVAARPLHDRLRRAANRIVYGARDEPYTVVAQLAGRLRVAEAPEALLSDVVACVATALRLEYLALEADGLSPLVAGRESPDPIRLPLVHLGSTVGRMTVGSSRSGALRARDRRLLDDLAPQIAVAVHAAQLVADLQRSREQIVTTREEERRRLRRDLHDGLGPTLASVALELEVARDLVAEDPSAVARSLERLGQRLTGTVAEVRRVVDDLRPSSLDDIGLSGALMDQIERFRQAGLDTAANIGPLPELSAAVEVAAFRIISEAMTNAARHARANHCEVTVHHDGDQLNIVIDDDGIGIDERHQVGVGLASMHERAAELGGSCTIESSSRGTRVTVVLPAEAR